MPLFDNTRTPTLVMLGAYTSLDRDPQASRHDNRNSSDAKHAGLHPAQLSSHRDWGHFTPWLIRLDPRRPRYAPLRLRAADLEGGWHYWDLRGMLTRVQCISAPSISGERRTRRWTVCLRVAVEVCSLSLSLPLSLHNRTCQGSQHVSYLVRWPRDDAGAVVVTGVPLKCGRVDQWSMEQHDQHFAEGSNLAI